MKTLLAVVAMLVLVGCATVGNQAITREDLLSQIVVGKSTQDDVRRLFGEPTTTSVVQTAPGTIVTTWIYSYGHAQFGAESRGASLVLAFDSDGRVQNVARSTTAVK